MKVLLAITAYNGRVIVPRAVTSGLRQTSDLAEIDVVVLDDCSPEPGFSEDLESFCALHGAGYYRSPRNLGIPRNVNLGLLMGDECGYDAVVISNSDVVYARGAIDQLLRVALTDPAIGAVTAWSTNVGAFSLPNLDPDRWLGNQEAVDAVGETLLDTFGTEWIEIPTAVSFAVLIPVAAIRAVGLMDPIFGRGYCEENDWSRRSKALGFRTVLAPGSFVYHQGEGTTREAGLLSAGHHSVPHNEVILDRRFPDFRLDVEHFFASGVLAAVVDRAVRAIIRQRPKKSGSDEESMSDVDEALRVDYLGFVLEMSSPKGSLATVEALVGDDAGI